MQPGMTAAFDETGSSVGGEDSGHHEGDPRSPRIQAHSPDDTSEGMLC
jgi:hypothetical protein